MPTHKDNIVLGSGKLYLALFDSNGVRGGFRYLGDTPGFTIQVTAEKTTVYGSDKKTRYKLVDKTIQVDHNGNFTARDVSDENTALFVGGEVVEISQSSASGSTYTINAVDQGLWYIIAPGSHLTGLRNISNVTVADADTSSSFTEGTDYELDLVRGKIYVIEGGSITDGTNLEVTYDAEANARKQVKTTDTVSRECALLYEADNAEGENRDVLMPYIDLNPDGDVGWKDLENAQEFGFAFTALELDSSTPALVIDGEAYTP